MFFENFRALITLAASAGDGKFAIPLGSAEQTAVPLIAAEDVARVAAAFLTAPAPREPGPVRLVGQVATVSEIVAAFSRTAGRDLEYADVPGAAWKRTAIASGINPHAAEHLASLWDIFRARGSAARRLPVAQLAGMIEQITGQPPQTLESFLQLSTT